MGLFRRSDKKKLQASQPQYQYEASEEIPRQPNLTTRSHWYYVEESPNILNGYNHDQSAPKGWLVAPLEPQSSRYQPQIAMAPPSLQRQRSGIALTKLKSVTNLFAEASLNDLPGAAAFNNGVAVMSQQTIHHYHQTTALYDALSSKLCSIVTSIDEERFSGDDRELTVPRQYDAETQSESTSRDLRVKSKKSKANLDDRKSSETTDTNYFSKVYSYVNSRLPMDLKPMRL